MALSKEVLAEKIKKAHVVVLNILPAGDFQELHIPGSHNLPYLPGETNFAQSAELKYGREKFFIVYGFSSLSPAAEDAALALRKKGLWAEAFPGGLDEWGEAGYPTEGASHSKKGVFS